MKRSRLIHIFSVFQLVALLTLQLNQLAPRIAQLYPALAAGDFSECRYNSSCACPPSSRASGNCCCKLLKKLSIKMHCAASKPDAKGPSLNACPCGGESQIGITTSASPVFLAHVIIQFHPIIQEQLLTTLEKPAPRDFLSEPPIPPPRLIHAGLRVTA